MLEGSGGFVTLAHYDNLHGFGLATTKDVADLTKALEAGYQIANQTGGSALRVQSLEESLKVTTYTNRHIRLWKKISKTPAYSTVEEYNELSAYGATQGAFIREGELPQTNDSTYTRRTEFVKFIGTTREVTHQAALVHPAHGDLIALENTNGILWILAMIERNLFSGDNGLAFSPPGLPGESEMWAGLGGVTGSRQLIDATSFLDLEGAPIQEADLETAANALIEAFAYPTDLFLSPRVNADLIKTFYPRERVNLPAPANGKVGLTVNSIVTSGGDVELQPDVFITRPATAPTAAAGPVALVPTAPATIAAALDGAATTGEFDKSQGTANATYAYRVSAVNRFGESAASAAATQNMTAAQAAAGNTFNLTITNSAALIVPPEYYNVYRTVALAAGAGAPAAFTSYSLVMRVPCQAQGAGPGVAGITPVAPGVVTDRNRYMPFTEQAYIGQLTPDVLTFRQLAPLMRMDLAVMAPSYRWMILLYGTPILFAPRKWLKLINIGRIG